MKPYYQDEFVTLYHGDARDVLPVLELPTDGMILTDPPYSSGGFQEAGKSAGSLTGRHKQRGESIAFDNLSTRGYERLMREVLRHCNQVDELYLFTDWRMWTPSCDAVEGAGWRVRNMLVWDKIQIGMGMPWRNQHELIVFGKRSAGEILSGKLGNVLRAKRSDRANHPTEKPTDLLQTIIGNSTAPTIIDPFMGSGSAIVAARNLQRNALGVEVEERYCETAAQRLSQEVFDLGGVA